MSAARGKCPRKLTPSTPKAEVSLINFPKYNATFQGGHCNKIGEGTGSGEPAVPMKCVLWNVEGLRDKQRRGIMGRYQHEWAAMLESCKPRDLNLAEQGFLEGFLAVNAVG